MAKQLLVADDSVVIQKSVGITFAQEDISITYVGNGAEAISKSKQIKPDLVLADIVMPMKNGYEVCEALKKDPQTASIPVLLLAGAHEPFDEAKGRSVGADGYVIKPFESQVLIDRVQEVLSGKSKAPAPAQAAAPPPPPAPTPSPASTIAQAAPKRDAPLLDLDLHLPQTPESPTTVPESSFDFSLDPSPAENPPPVATSTTDVSALPSGDLWDFSIDASQEASSAPPIELESPSSPTPAQEPWGTIAAGSWAEPEVAPAAIPETQAPLESGPSLSEDFGFDLSAPEGQSQIEDSSVGEPFEFSVAAEAAQNIAPADYSRPEVTAPIPRITQTASAGSDLQFSDVQIEAIVTKVFQKVIERIAWEVVPDLAESIIKEEIKRLTQDKK